VAQLLAAGVGKALGLLRELPAAGSAGRLTIRRRYIAPNRALRLSRATVRFETEPGHHRQSDWGTLTRTGGPADHRPLHG